MAVLLAYTYWYCRWVSGWLCLASCSSPWATWAQGITAAYASHRPSATSSGFSDFL